MLIQVHDELVFNVIAEEKDVMAGLVKGCMEGIVNYSIPLSIEMEFAANWKEAH